MKKHDDDRIKQLLQQSLPPVDPAAEPSRDLWPAVLGRLDAESVRSATAPGPLRQNWFDWALLAGLVVFAFSFPATIPVFLYYL
ncbi:MAG: hypothetical protein ABSD61_11325 [Terracidiphilus sp.]|jgi:hypothetical protein